MQTWTPNSGYLFGGYYTSSQSNPFTGTMFCPQHYFTIHFSSMQALVSNDHELGQAHATSLAGFQSCHTDPLAAPTMTLQSGPKNIHTTFDDYQQWVSTLVLLLVHLTTFFSFHLTYLQLSEYEADLSYIHVPALVGVYGQL